jgi:DNA-binding transcriptional LysR family regulator
MTILRIIDDSRMLTVAAPDYLARHSKPTVPKELHAHNCVRCRAPWDGSTEPWSYTKGDQQAEIAVDGSLVVNDIDALLRTVLDGVGVGHLPEPIVASHVAQGRLVTLLDGWSRTTSGVFLYHPSRRQTPMPLQVFLRFVEKWRKLIPQPVA